MGPGPFLTERRRGRGRGEPEGKRRGPPGQLEGEQPAGGRSPGFVQLRRPRPRGGCAVSPRRGDPVPAELSLGCEMKLCRGSGLVACKSILVTPPSARFETCLLCPVVVTGITPDFIAPGINGCGPLP